MADVSDVEGSRGLTPRQREVLALLRLGLTDQQIGERLGISTRSAKYHVSEIGWVGISTTRSARTSSTAAGRRQIRSSTARRSLVGDSDDPVGARREVSCRTQ